MFNFTFTITAFYAIVHNACLALIIITENVGQLMCFVWHISIISQYFSLKMNMKYFRY